MLPVENFVKTNFVDGIKFNPEQIQLTDNYYDCKIGLSNAFGIGRGILVGFKHSLKLEIVDNTLILKSGALIDNDGNIIYVPKEYTILNSIGNSQFQDKKSLYIYIKYMTEFEDLQESIHDKDLKLHYKISENYKVIIQEKSFRDKSLMELGRFYVNTQNDTNLKTATNPYDPADNEIDIRFAPKIISKNLIMNYNEKVLISSVIKKYSNFLNELGFRKKIMSASQAASYGYKVATDITLNEITPWQLYDLLYELLNISLQIYTEKVEIVNTAFWKNIKRLQSIFNFDEKYDVDYYSTYLEVDNSFFSKIIMHYSNASIFDGNWDKIIDDEKEDEDEKAKEYLVIGSDASCDIIVENEDVAPKHAKLYKYKSGYFIEEIGETSGVYVNAQRLEKGVKKFIKHQDYVVLGKNGKVLNLNNI